MSTDQATDPIPAHAKGWRRHADSSAAQDTKTDQGTKNGSSGGTFAPLRNKAYAFFLLALFVSSAGSWMFAVGAAWLMTDLDASDTMVALVQTASLLPVMLFSVPGGALGDLFDRRRVLLISQIALASNAVAFALVVQTGIAQPWLVLLFAAIGGTGTAFARPTMNAVIPTMVGRSDLMAAMNLKSIAFNLSRAVGPAVAGGLVALLGQAAPFWGDAISFSAVIAFLFFWRPKAKVQDDLPREHLSRAVRAAFVFARYDPALRQTLAKTILFFLPAAALWSLMPLIARERLDGGAFLYGLMLGGAGIGAVMSGLVVKRIDQHFGSNTVVAGGTVLLALSLCGLALANSAPLAVGIAIVGGAGWQIAFSLCSTSAQYALPTWIGARGMALFQMAMFGGLGLGSAGWGALSERTDIATSLFVAAGTALVLGVIAWRFKLNLAKGADLSPADDFPAHDQVTGKPGRGPVMVQIAYDLGRADRADITRRVRALRKPRLREGVMDWGLYADPDHEGRLIESYTSPSWDEHERERSRLTKDDQKSAQAIETALRAAGGSRTVTHFLPVDGQGDAKSSKTPAAAQPKAPATSGKPHAPKGVQPA